jgi:hypothetical protein
MFEKPQKAQVVRIKIEAISLDSTSIAPSLDGPLLANTVEKLRFRSCSKDYRPPGPSFNFGRGGKRTFALRGTKIVLTEPAPIRGGTSKFARTTDQHGGQIGPDAPVAQFVGIGQRVAVDRQTKAHM